MSPDSIQQRALETWYEDDNDLQKCPYPCLLGLAGEAGELVDLLKKDCYKPRYRVKRKEWLGEAGDVLFYLAIRCFQLEVTLKQLPSMIRFNDDLPILFGQQTFDKAIVTMNETAAELLAYYWTNTRRLASELEKLGIILACVKSICREFVVTLDQLSWMNYEKLAERESNGTGYNRGRD